MKTSDVIVAANCDGHRWSADVDSPTTLTCKDCPWRFAVTEDSIGVVTTIMTPVQLFNYGIWLYGAHLLERELAWRLIDTAIAVALSRLAPDELEELKAAKRAGPEVWDAVDLSQYCFEVVTDGAISDLSTFHWHTWRVVGNLVKEDREQ